MLQLCNIVGLTSFNNFQLNKKIFRSINLHIKLTSSHSRLVKSILAHKSISNYRIYLYLSIYTVSPSLLSFMHRAAWGEGKPGHISAFPGYACETTATRRRQPNHIHSARSIFSNKYFVPGWTRTRTEEVSGSVVKYSASTDWAIPAP